MTRIRNCSPFIIRRAFFSPLGVCLLSVIVLAGWDCGGDDPVCTTPSTFQIENNDGQCYQVQVTQTMESTASGSPTSFTRTVCSSESQTVPEGDYTYTATLNGTQVSSGTQHVQCGQRISIVLGTTGHPGADAGVPIDSGAPSEITTQGSPTAFPGDPQLYCMFTNPRSQIVTVKWTYYTYACANGYNNTYTLNCAGSCQIGAGATVTGAPLFDGNCAGGLIRATCSVRLIL